MSHGHSSVCGSTFFPTASSISFRLFYKEGETDQNWNWELDFDYLSWSGLKFVFRNFETKGVDKNEAIGTRLC